MEHWHVEQILSTNDVINTLRSSRQEAVADLYFKLEEVANRCPNRKAHMCLETIEPLKLSFSPDHVLKKITAYICDDYHDEV